MANSFTKTSAKALSHEILVKYGACEIVADIISDVLVHAEGDGVKSHGLARLPDHVASIKAGWADPTAVPSIEKIRPGLLRAEGNNGFTPVGARLARKQLIEMARSEGMAALCARNSHHIGALWCDIEPLAYEGLVAFNYVHSRPRMSVYGSSKSLLGTNAMAFTYPDGKGGAITFDQASSLLSLGDVRLHAQAGKPIAEGVGLTKEGAPTTDPNDIMAGGPLLPFGGHKGASIAMMVEIMAAAMTGAAFGFEDRSKDFPGASSSYAGQFILVLDPSVTSGSDASGRLADFVSHLHSDPSVRLPGERRHANRMTSEQNGLSIDPDLHQRLLDLRAD
jgi:delta1-piperideine-2-carboxylate reductase